MKCKFNRKIIVFALIYFVLRGVSFSDTYTDIAENHRDLMLHKVFNREGVTVMGRDAGPFKWLDSKIAEIGGIKSMKFVRVELIDNQSPIGNSVIKVDDNQNILQIPKYKTNVGNGLDYMWFSLVWGINYYERSNQISLLIKSHGKNEINDEGLVNELVKIRCEVVIETRKFFDDVWQPWCKQVGALPTSPVLWLNFAEVADQKLLVEQLRRSGDVGRIVKWVENL